MITHLSLPESVIGIYNPMRKDFTKFQSCRSVEDFRFKEKNAHRCWTLQLYTSSGCVEFIILHLTSDADKLIIWIWYTCILHTCHVWQHQYLESSFPLATKSHYQHSWHHHQKRLKRINALCDPGGRKDPDMDRDTKLYDSTKIWTVSSWTVSYLE